MDTNIHPQDAETSAPATLLPASQWRPTPEQQRAWTAPVYAAPATPTPPVRERQGGTLSPAC